MSTDKLKGRPPIPFETIAVAIAFSPRFEAILSEAGHLADKFKAKLLLIHVGPKTANKEEKLNRSLDKLGLSGLKNTIVWREGRAANVILQVCKENVVDLLVIGALKKESLFTFYLGSLARTISRKAKCSVLLVTQPGINSTSPKKLVVTGIDHPKTIHTINTAVYFAKAYKIPEIRVVKELDLTGLAMTLSDNTTATAATKLKKEITEGEEDKLHNIIRECQAEGINILEKTVKGKAGYALSKYSLEKKADILFINSPDISLGLLDRIFTHDVELILANLPCDIMLVHSRVKSEK